MQFKQKSQQAFRKIVGKVKRDLLLVGLFAATNCTSVVTMPLPCYGLCEEKKLSLASDAMHYNTITPIEVETYEHSGKIVHPDVLVFPDEEKVNKYSNVLIATPLADQGDRVENPSIYFSNNWRHWIPPSLTTNPIAIPSDTSWKVHLSDPSILYDFSNEAIRVNYRETHRGLEDRIYTMTSKDLVNWSKPELVLTGKQNSMISPTFVTFPHGSGRVWYISAEKGCLSKTTELKARAFDPKLKNFGFEKTNNLSQPGYVIWHVNIDYIESKKIYAGLAAAYPTGKDCETTDLFFISSSDGTNWKTYSNPLLRRKQSNEFTNSVYESSLSYNPKNHTTTIIYSGTNEKKGFHLASEKMIWSSLMTRIGPENKK